MSQVIDANEFTVTMGLYEGNTHAFVTHRATGVQWVSKSPYRETADLGMLAMGIRAGYLKFSPSVVIGSCDSRFFYRVEKAPPMPRSEFDALCFIGD